MRSHNFNILINKTLELFHHYMFAFYYQYNTVKTVEHHKLVRESASVQHIYLVYVLSPHFLSNTFYLHRCIIVIFKNFPEKSIK